MSDDVEFVEVTREEFAQAWEEALYAVRERPSLTRAEIDAGWREDAGGLRRNVRTGEWDDSCFVHLAARRPRPTTPGNEVRAS